MNEALKRYFRKKGDRHQDRMDKAWARKGKNANAWHGKALKGKITKIKKAAKRCIL